MDEEHDDPPGDSKYEALMYHMESNGSFSTYWDPVTLSVAAGRFALGYTIRLGDGEPHNDLFTIEQLAERGYILVCVDNQWKWYRWGDTKTEYVSSKPAAILAASRHCRENYVPPRPDGVPAEAVFRLPNEGEIYCEAGNSPRPVDFSEPSPSDWRELPRDGFNGRRWCWAAKKEPTDHLPDAREKVKNMPTKPYVRNLTDAEAAMLLHNANIIGVSENKGTKYFLAYQPESGDFVVATPRQLPNGNYEPAIGDPGFVAMTTNWVNVTGMILALKHQEDSESK